METPTKLLHCPGTIPSEVWGARTEPIVNYVVIPPSPPVYEEEED
jgi:hypothetical protein